MHLIVKSVPTTSFAMGKIYYITSHGELSRHENTLLFKNSQMRKSIPIEDVDEIFIFGELSLNTKVLNILASNGIVVHFFNYYGYYAGSFYPRETNLSGYLLIKQAQHHLEPSKRLYLAKAFIYGALLNISKVYDFDASEFYDRLDRAKKTSEVMQIEGDFRKLCYQILEKQTGWIFGKRTKRPPQNPLNALISFGNSLVYAKVLGEIYQTQLNPTISYLHEPSTKRFSLALDVAEVFKPLFSDCLILKLLKEEKLIEDAHFLQEMNYAYLSPEGRRIFISEFNKLLEDTLNHKKLKRKISHKTLIKLELYKLIKHLLEEETYLPLNYAVCG